VMQKEVLIIHMDYALQNVANLVPINDELVIQVEKILFVLIFFDDHQVMNLMIQHKVHQMLMKIMMDVNNDLVLEQEHQYVLMDGYKFYDDNVLKIYFNKNS
jgi:hypothetical protein